MFINMRKDFDAVSRRVVTITIGGAIAKKDEESFFGLLGTVVATAILGKIPSREDRASFMGTSESKLAKLVKNAVDGAYYEGNLKNWLAGYSVGCPSVNNAIHALATQLIANGFYVGDEPASRRAAREFLNNYFRPQAIQNAVDFLGYQMVLEYLWYLTDRSEIIEFKKFVSLRYDEVPNKVQGFCDVVADFATEKGEVNTSLAERGKYSSVISGLVNKMLASGKLSGNPEI